MGFAKRSIGLSVLFLAQVVFGQQQPSQPQKPLSIGETKLDAGAVATFGYNGGYGSEVSSSHGLDFGFDGTINGSYYNPNFLSFVMRPYYDQSRANSESQSITGASGFTGSANLFNGSHFPGAVNYSFADNSTGSYGLVGQPNFTTHGKTQEFGINWSELLPNWPSLAVGYSQGNDDSTIYGTAQEANTDSRRFNLHSNYRLDGFNLNGFFDHNSIKSEFPEFIAGEGAALDEESGHDYGFGVTRPLPQHGSFSLGYGRTSESIESLSNLTQTSQSLTSQSQNESLSNLSYSNETATAIFHPLPKLSWNITQTYADNLAGSVAQSFTGGTGTAVIPLGLNFGPGSHSSTFGGGVNYSFTPYLSGGVNATYYDQEYFGKSYSGEFLSGNISYAGRLWNMFAFSASVIDSSSDLASNSVGFTGNVNFFRRFGGWSTSAAFTYGQNVETVLFTYTTSSYGYGATVGHRLPGNISWGASFGGNHSGLEQVRGNSTHSETYSTFLSMRKMSLTAAYGQSNGISLLGAAGLVTVTTPVPGLSNQILYTGSYYSGGLSLTPISRLVLSGAFSRSISDTMAATFSHNGTEVFSAQLQYHLRRIGLQAGYLRFSQGISAIGSPVSTTSYFAGFTRWFNFF